MQISRFELLVLMDTCYETLSINGVDFKWPLSRREGILNQLYDQMDTESVTSEPQELTKHDYTVGGWGCTCSKCKTPYYGTRNSTVCASCAAKEESK